MELKKLTWNKLFLGHDPPGGERNLFIEMPELVRPQNNRVFPYGLNSPLELTCVSGL